MNTSSRKCRTKECDLVINSDIQKRYSSYCPLCALDNNALPASHRFESIIEATTEPVGQIKMIGLILQNDIPSQCPEGDECFPVLRKLITQYVPESLCKFELESYICFSDKAFDQEALKKDVIGSLKWEAEYYQQKFDPSSLKFWMHHFHDPIHNLKYSGSLVVAYELEELNRSIDSMKYVKESISPDFENDVEGFEQYRILPYVPKIYGLHNNGKTIQAIQLCKELRCRFPGEEVYYLMGAMLVGTRNEALIILHEGLLRSKMKSKLCYEIGIRSSLQYTFDRGIEIEPNGIFHRLNEQFQWYFRSTILQLRSGVIYEPFSFQFMAYLCKYLGLKESFVMLNNFVRVVQDEDFNYMYPDVRYRQISRKVAWYLKYIGGEAILRSMATFFDILTVYKNRINALNIL